MKTCSKCGITKALSDFFIRNKKTGRLHAQCKQCYQQHRQLYQAQHYQKYRNNYLARAKERREKLRREFQNNLTEYLADKRCELCDENDIRVLEFDHIDPTRKRFSISQGVKLGYSWKEIQKEIKRCRILCANCHKKHTANQFGWYKSIIGGTDRI
jgi:hypothetical protein